MARSKFSGTTLSLPFLLLALACGDGKGSEVGASGVDAGGSNGSGSNGSGAASSGADSGTGANANIGANSSGTGASNGVGGKLLIDVGGEQNGGGTTGSTGNGKPELCDGVDNDENGIIDDVDAGHDGVCDCLNIATIGHIGPWSNGGNIFASWLNARSPLGAVELADEEITTDKLKPFQIVVVLHAATSEVSNNGVVAPAHHAFSDAEAEAFNAWVRAGGGVMTTIGYTGNEAEEVINVNKLLGKLGMGYSTSKLGLTGNVSTWQTHPVTDGISNIFTDNGVEPDPTLGTTVAMGGAEPALQVLETDEGRIAVWGDEWITYDSEWADVEGQQVELFWLNLLKWLSPPTQCQVPIPSRVK